MRALHLSTLLEKGRSLSLPLLAFAPCQPLSFLTFRDRGRPLSREGRPSSRGGGGEPRQPSSVRSAYGQRMEEMQAQALCADPARGEPFGELRRGEGEGVSERLMWLMCSFTITMISESLKPSSDSSPVQERAFNMATVDFDGSRASQKSQFNPTVNPVPQSASC